MIFCIGADLQLICAVSADPLCSYARSRRSEQSDLFFPFEQNDQDAVQPAVRVKWNVHVLRRSNEVLKTIGLSIAEVNGGRVFNRLT